MWAECSAMESFQQLQGNHLAAASLPVRSPPPHCAAGNRAERFIAASSFRAIHDVVISHDGAGRDGRQRDWVLLGGESGRERARTDFPAGGAGRRASAGWRRRVRSLG